MWKAKWTYWGAQIIGWGLFYGLIAFFELGSNKSGFELFLRIITITSISIVTTHFWRYIALKYKFFAMHFPKILLPIFFSLLFISTIGAALNMVTDFRNYEFHNAFRWDWKILLSKIFLNTLLNGFWMLLYISYFLYEKARNQEMDNLRLIAYQRAIELKNLQSQLNPHFLFNALNSIRALVDVDPKKAREAITSLSIILRKSLESGKEEMVTLEQELALVHSYLALEQIRFEERLRVKLDIDESLLAHKIPPFAIQTLVENAIKHGVSKLIEGGDLTISILKIESELKITIFNTGELNSFVDTGIGVKNVEQRLYFAFGNKASFTLKQNGGVVAQIAIKL
jgi:two-component system LytT family sensor kinase